MPFGLGGDPSDRKLSKLLAPIGKPLGLDWLDFTAGAILGGSPVHPFGMVVAGGQLLVNYSDSAFLFPSWDTGAKKKGAKLLNQAMGQESARRAAVFLANALGWYVYDRARAQGDQVGMAIAASAIEDLSALWPLTSHEIGRLADARGQYETLIDHTLQPGLVGNGFHAALRRGEDPDENENLVAMQSAWAARYLFHHAGIDAVAIAVGPSRFEELGHLLIPDEPPLTLAAEHRAFLEKETATWLHYLDHWLAARDLKQTPPS